MIVNRSMYPVSQGFASVAKLQSRLSDLQLQLATGEKASTLAQMGSDRTVELNLRARIGRLESYQQSIQTTNLRLDFFDQALARLDELEADTRASATPGGVGPDGMNAYAVPELSLSRLDELVQLLNTDVSGRYLFGGNKTDEKPVASLSAMLDGESGKAGFRTVANERRLADVGATGMGRTEVVRSGAEVTLSEDGAHPFGFKLSTLSTGSSAISLTAPAGNPASLAVEINGTPIPSDAVTIGLRLPDGTEMTVTLKAVAGTPGAGEFQIGATQDTTAQSFEQALKARLIDLGKTELPAASGFAAAENFFNGRGEPILRVDGPPFETATQTRLATATDTVQWYRGADAAGNPRQTVTSKVDDSTSVNYGVQANESGIVSLMRSLATMAIQNFDPTDTSSAGRFDTMSTRQRQQLSESHNGTPGSIETITLDLGIARTTLGTVSERQTVYANQLDTILADISQVAPEQVAMELLSLNTRLAASYQTMAMVSQMSLVNYL